jgi:hypothetical protein
MQFALTMLAYLVPTFALGFIWHLVLFARYYEALAMYRRDIIVPFGFLSMLIQAAIFAWLYQRVFTGHGRTPLARAAAYGAVGAVLSWSFTTLAVAAKNVMASVPDYLLIETLFTGVQWTLVAASTALVTAAPWSRRIPGR